MTRTKSYVRWFEALGADDVAHVGGKNASLGEMIRALKDEGIRIPDGFATTADAYRAFLEANDLLPKIRARLKDWQDGDTSLAQLGKGLRRLFQQAEFPEDIAAAICQAYRELSERYGSDEVDVAVRSSATAEDLPEASFAGQQETFLNVCGLDSLLVAVKHVFASLYNDRAIAYRAHHGFDQRQIALSAGIQQMVRSDMGASGVIFTLDTESGFPEVVFITSSYGLGETVVQGAVNPDEFYVYKPNLKTEQPAILRRNLGEKAIKMIFGDKKTPTRTVEVSLEDRAQFSLTDPEVEE